MFSGVLMFFDEATIQGMFKNVASANGLSA